MKKTVLVVAILALFVLVTLGGGSLEPIDSIPTTGLAPAGFRNPPVPGVSWYEYTDSAHFYAGSTSSGTHSDTHADDGTYHVIDDSAGHDLDMYYNIINDTFDDTKLVQIDVRVVLKRSADAPTSAEFFLYNFDTPAWESQGSESVGTSDTQLDFQITSSCDEYVRDHATYNGEFYLRIDFGVDPDDYTVSVDYLHIYYTTNETPVNHDAKCVDPHDTDNLYARVRWYQFTVNVSDGDGYSDIDYLLLELVQGAFGYWAVKYDEDTDTFSEYAVQPAVELDTAGSSYTKSGTNLNVTFQLKIEWYHEQKTDWDLEVETVDSSSNSDVDVYDLDYDMETRLDLSSLAVDDNVGTVDRGDISGAFYVTGTIVYFGGTVNPDSGGLDVVDVWANTSYSDTTLSAGAFNVTCTAEATVGNYTYLVKVVQDGAGSGGSDECHASHYDYYTADRINVTISVTYTRRQVGLNVSDFVVSSAYYDYDGGVVSGAAYTWNDTDYAHSTVGAYGYKVSSADGVDTHGITTVYSNAISVTFDKPISTVTYYWVTTPTTSTLIVTLSPVTWCSNNATRIPDIAYIVIERNESWYATHYPIIDGHFQQMAVAVPTSWGHVNITLLFTFQNSTFYFNEYNLFSEIINTQTDETTMFFYFYGLDGTEISSTRFKIYVDGYRLPLPYYITSESTVNLTLTDFWNYTLYQDTTLTVTEYVDIQLPLHWLILGNQQDYACDAVIEFNSANRTWYVGEGATEVLCVVSNTNITVYWFRSEDSHHVKTDVFLSISGDITSTTDQEYDPPDPSGGGVGWIYMVFTWALIIGVFLILLIGLCAVFVRAGRGDDYEAEDWEEGEPRQLTPEEQYDEPEQEYDRITREAREAEKQ